MQLSNLFNLIELGVLEKRERNNHIPLYISFSFYTFLMNQTPEIAAFQLPSNDYSASFVYYISFLFSEMYKEKFCEYFLVLLRHDISQLHHSIEGFLLELNRIWNLLFQSYFFQAFYWVSRTGLPICDRMSLELCNEPEYEN